MISKETLNQCYKELEVRATMILGQLISIRQKEVMLQYFSGHYSKNEQGIYEIENYPIPVISAKNLCDIEINLDQINITTKMKRSDFFQFDLKKLTTYTYELYGVNDYLSTYGSNQSKVDEIIVLIMTTNETEIAFGFTFPNETAPLEFKKFTHMLEHNGFFY